MRLCKTHHAWTATFLASPTVLGILDPSGIALIHPRRAGRRPQQIGRKGRSNQRWRVGGTLGLLLKPWGVIVAWEGATAKVPEKTFQPPHSPV